MSIETERGPNLSQLDYGERDRIAQAPILIRVTRENLSAPFLFTGKDPEDWETSPQKPLQCQGAAEFMQEQSVSFRFNIVGDEARASLRCDSLRSPHRALVVSVIGVEQGENGA
jgi:hypothetical protein